MKSQGKPTQQGLRMGVTPASSDNTADAMNALGANAGMSRIDTGYQQAIVVHTPRNLKAVEADIIYEASQMGEDFIYTWDVNDKESKRADGKTRIEGMSIDGAMIMLRNWGNAACPVDLVEESPTHYLLRATFIDLEKGFNAARLYRQRKSGGPGKMENERREDMAFQIGQSKAIRNAVDKGMPAWLRDRAIEASKSAAATKYKDVQVHVPKVVEWAKGLGVSEAQLVARVGRPLVGWTPYDIVYVRTIFKAISDRQTTALEEFPPLETPAPSTPPAEEKADDFPPETKTTTVVTPDGVIVETPASSPPATPPAPATPAASAPIAPPTPPIALTPEQKEAEEAERALAAQEAKDAAAAATMAKFDVPGFAKPPEKK